MQEHFQFRSGIANQLPSFALGLIGLFLTTTGAFASANLSFTAVQSMGTSRYSHTATLLGNGKILVAGGTGPVPGGFASLDSAEVYDPATGAFTPVSNMTSQREAPTATLLPNGKVLIAGGIQRQTNGTLTYLNSAELFDPATGTFAPVSSMSSPRQFHTATVLGNGKVLIAGGDSAANNGTLDTAELFDPATSSFTSLGLSTLSEARSSHTATLLPNGKVLFAGGYHHEGPFDIGNNTAEVFDPASGTFTSLSPNNLTTVRYYHTATVLPNGKVLITGGLGGGVNGNVSNTAELFDPATGAFTSVAPVMTSARAVHTATLLPNGKVLLAGGQNNLVSTLAITNTAELFDPAMQTFTPIPPMSSARTSHTATLLCDGRVLVTGGFSGAAVLNSTELFDFSSPTFTSLSPNTMTVERGRPTVTLLSSGKVLIAGGESNADYLNTAEYFDAASNTFTPVPNVMTTKRIYQTATSLPNGKVLMAGGKTGLFETFPTDTAEVFGPVSETFTSVPSMAARRIEHTATLLANGKVLIVGGSGGNVYLDTAELFDPNTNTFTLLSHTMTSQRFGHTATLLPNGKVLISGGITIGYTVVNTAELFDPVTQTFTPVSPMTAPQYGHTATLLPSGKVLIAGGYDGTDYVDTAELFDPATNTFVALPPMNSARYLHTATLLPGGKVLITGGIVHVQVPNTNTAELFDPVLGTFTSLLPATMTSPRASHAAVLLPIGKILIAGGYTIQTEGNTNTAEIFDLGLGFSDARRPIISNPVDPVVMPASMVLHGSGFRGDSEANAGSPQSSATNYPVIQLMRIDNDQIFFPLSDPATNWSDTTFASETLGTASTRLPVGRYRVTVFANGIPSLQKVIDIEGGTIPAVPLVGAVSRKAHGNFALFDIQLPITGSPGIECRSGGANGDHTIVFTFANTLTSVDDISVSSGVGTVSSSWISGDMQQYVVTLTGVTNSQVITVSLTNVHDSVGNFSSAVSASMGLLLGDVNGNGVVSNSDVASVKAQVAAPVGASNFRDDVNANGVVSNTDVSATKAQVGTTLP